MLSFKLDILKICKYVLEPRKILPNHNENKKIHFTSRNISRTPEVTKARPTRQPPATILCNGVVKSFILAAKTKFEYNESKNSMNGRQVVIWLGVHAEGGFPPTLADVQELFVADVDLGFICLTNDQ